MKSIGEILKRTREKKKLTIEDVQKYVKIHPKYLKALEKDDYSVFSSKVHSKGFLKIYSDFLGLDENEILALWRRDYEKEIDLKPKREFQIANELNKTKIIVTPGIIFIMFVVVALVMFFSYLFY
jgi:cytoskeletal protein RodZ